MKQALRQRIIADRQALAPALRREWSLLIAQRLAEMPEYQAARTVLGYMHFGAEFESELWVERALADGKTLWLPRVNAATRTLDLYRVADIERDLAPGAWNIREPVPGRCARMSDLAEADFILLPGAAFGKNGARLGYGGGFYDKLLERFDGLAPTLAAGAYAMQVVENIPEEPLDRRIEWLVTENETVHCI
jgi:5-formyltetrahydrofolate cyclo-ligase